MHLALGNILKLSVPLVLILFVSSCSAKNENVNPNLPCVPVPVRPCPGVTNKAELVAVYIQGCIAEPCEFTKGQNVEMEMDIKFKEPVQSIHAQLHAIIGGPIQWDGVNPNACEDIVSEGDCPFEENDFITYGVKLSVSKGYPTVSPDVRYTILDNNGDIQVCWIVRASVVPPK